MTEIHSPLSLSGISRVALHVKPCAWLLLSHFLNCALASDAWVVGKRDALALTIPLRIHTHTHTYISPSIQTYANMAQDKMLKKISRNQGHPERWSNRRYGGTSGKKKKPPTKAGDIRDSRDMGLVPGSGKCPAGGNCNLLQ